MILRGEVLEDHLLFEAEIEKVVRKNRKSKAKENQEDNREDSSTSSSFSIDIFQENNNMAGEETPPPRRTLGDYAIHQGPRHFSSIVVPATNRALEMKHAFLTLISTNRFTTMDHEDPHTHLSTFMNWWEL